ncbi:MAG: CDP-alcohol phosphatidyltransferase family protein [Pseudomonadota bacterium]|nr:CDP-alcohol phosphatidyltransferase family protein [Pseudomonadota bacterium]
MTGYIYNLPNLVSFMRALTAFPIVYSIKHNNPVVFLWIALAVFSDWLDGFLARRLNIESKLGASVDPIADFVVIASVMTYFTVNGYMSYYLWWLMCIRYFTIFTAATLIVHFTDVTPRSNFLGKCSVCLFSIYGLGVLLSFDEMLMTITLSIFIVFLMVSWFQYLRTYSVPLCSVFYR